MNRKERFNEIEKLCRKLMAVIAEVVPILPLSLVATAILENALNEPSGLTAPEIEDRCNQLIEQLSKLGAPIFESPRSTRTRAIMEALDMMILRRMVKPADESFVMIAEEEPLIRYYANAIAHWFQADGKIAL
jgi:glycerol-3-phosphate O-acyltransferase